MGGHVANEGYLSVFLNVPVSSLSNISTRNSFETVT